MIFKVAQAHPPGALPPTNNTATPPTGTAPTVTNPDGVSNKDLNSNDLTLHQSPNTKYKSDSAFMTAFKKNVQIYLFNQKALEQTEKQLTALAASYEEVKKGFYAAQATPESLNTPCDVLQASGFSTDQTDMDNIANSYSSMIQQYMGLLTTLITQAGDIKTVVDSGVDKDKIGPLITSLDPKNEYLQEGMMNIYIQKLKTDYYVQGIKYQKTMAEVSLFQALLPLKTQFVDFFSALCETYQEHEQIKTFMGRTYLPYVIQMRDAYYYGSQMCRQMAAIVTRIAGPRGKNETQKYLFMAKKIEGLGITVVKEYMDGLKSATGR